MEKITTIYHLFGAGLKLLAMFVFSSWLLFSCTERIDIKSDEEFQKLAVEGYITPEIQVVKLTKTSGYFSQEAPAPVGKAIVVVTKNGEEYLFTDSEENPGNYQPPENFIVNLEDTFSLSIDLVNEIGGETYFESDVTMPELSDQTDSIQVKYRSDFEQWIVYLYAYEPAGENYYMFSALVNGEAVTDSLTRIGITDDRLVNGIYLNGVWVLSLYQDEVNVGDTVTLLTSSITGDYYRYLAEAKQEVFPKNPFFSGPPANVRSNISNGAVGYFAVFSSTYTSTIVEEKEE